MSPDFAIVGKSVPRFDAPPKATGAAQYVDDLVLPRMLHGRILRSPHAHVRILNVDASRALRLPGVKGVITGRDVLPVKYGIVPKAQDEYALAIEKVRYVGDDVAAVCAVDEDTAEEALSLIQVEYEILPAVFDPEEAMKLGAPVIHEGVPDNISVRITKDFGDIDAGFEIKSCGMAEAIEKSAAAVGWKERKGKLPFGHGIGMSCSSFPSGVSNMSHQDGHALNANFLDYKMPTAQDLAGEIVSVPVETDDPEGPFGAKEAGEGTLVPTPAAVANAVYDAIGVRVYDLPITPQKILDALEARKQKK